ncbi:hypothetical protein [Roseovarius sp. MS2]|uniref:hypothetical protein n=1 Tax=Roseovarius sp. MS2 TaxID=3390728 RepID=UPI003F5B499C
MPGQPYLDELRPGDWKRQVALFATYSVDLSAVAATLLALIGRNNEKAAHSVDFAQAIDTLRDRVRIIIQRGRIARPVALPRIAGILDQFIAEQDHDERDRSWHPKIALVAYDCPRGEIRWKLWIGSRNLTRSQDLDVGVLLDGTNKRAKGRGRLKGVGALAATLARAASRTDAEHLAEQLEAIWWQAPEGFQLRSLLNGLDEDTPLPAQPPTARPDRWNNGHQPFLVARVPEDGRQMGTGRFQNADFVDASSCRYGQSIEQAAQGILKNPSLCRTRYAARQKRRCAPKQ